MSLVAGIDSSTQSVKVLICDAASGELVRQGRASHPDGSEIHPDHWWSALQLAIEAAGGLADVAAMSVGGQQHGMVVLDENGEVIRPALLWNDTRSADAAEKLILAAGQGDRAAGAAWWASHCGSVPVASLTITKLAWLGEHEPDLAGRVAAVCLPHDWLNWRLAGHGPRSAGGDGAIDALWTDRSDASGTGYWSPFTNDYDRSLLAMAFRSDVILPKVLAPNQVGGRSSFGALIGPGAGDNAAAALGLGLAIGDVCVSLGTSGVVSAISPTPMADSSGLVAGFADATGAYLPLACTLNASRVVDAATHLLGLDYGQVADLALHAEPGADGLTLVPYFEGERTPNKPHASASLIGMTLANLTPANVARAFVEGMLCCQAAGLDAMTDLGFEPKAVMLIGGGAQSPATRVIAPAILGYPVSVPPEGEYVARGAARQAAWVLTGDDRPPVWPISGSVDFTADPTPIVRQRYNQVNNLTFPLA
ncbi:MAG: xylulose kinase [Propionibacteriaceae bacterium]|jgi:xylulokinase|nr:xylulose kinase [Propionibacteriaceae bacterium]